MCQICLLNRELLATTTMGKSFPTPFQLVTLATVTWHSLSLPPPNTFSQTSLKWIISCVFVLDFSLDSYCDVFQKCREVDPSGPLATLRKLLLSEESIASFKKWIQHNWYTVALTAIGVFILLVGATLSFTNFTSPQHKH